MISKASTRNRHGDFLIPLLSVLLDSIAIEAAFLLSYWIRFRSSLFEYLGYTLHDSPPIEGYVLGSFLIIVIWLMLFNSRKMYGARRSITLADEFINIVKVVSLGMLVVMSVAFFYREFSYSRVVFALLWATSIAFIFSGRGFTRYIERRLYRKGKNLQRAIILGSDAIANRIFKQLHSHPSFGFDIVGYFSAEPADPSSRLAATVHLGGLEDVPQFIHREEIEIAFIALRSEDHQALFELISECEGINIDFMMVPDVLEVLTSQVRVKELEGIPFLRIKSIPFTMWGRISKRSFDIIVASLLLLGLSPILAFIALVIRMSSKGPVFFRQERVGLDGASFTMYKFRSMKVGSDALDGQSGLGVRNDPRRTPIGIFLRKTSLDELPQLFNVIRGEMSLVGPRPERTSYVQKFQGIIPKYLDRHRVKTGLTGWAQVNGLRGDTSIEERIKHDLYYIENWSLAFDIKILLRTVRAALETKEVH